MLASQNISPVPNCVRSLAGRPRRVNRSELVPYVGCKCGACLWCQDNAKWDRIFEKFIDPRYYDRDRPARMYSPLAEL